MGMKQQTLVTLNIPIAGKKTKREEFLDATEEWNMVLSFHPPILRLP